MPGRAEAGQRSDPLVRSLKRSGGRFPSTSPVVANTELHPDRRDDDDDDENDRGYRTGCLFVNEFIGFDWDDGNKRKNLEKHGVSDSACDWSVGLCVAGDCFLYSRREKS
jgi:hypothetical protein